MIRNLGLIVTTALACTYATGASAAELAVTEASIAEATAQVDDSSAYGVAAASSLAAAQSTASGGSGWEFAITPYLWASGMKVDVDTPQGEHISSDVSFGDILGDLKFAMMGAFEAKHGRIVSLQDLMYLSVGSSASGDLGPGLVTAKLDEKTLVTTHLAGYRVVDKGPMFLDLMAGARITSIKVNIKLSGPLQTVHRSDSDTKIGPVIASRFRAPLGGRWGFAMYGDLGGFGVTADLSWQLLGTIQYDLSDRWRLLGGWRHFNAKKDKNDFDVDLKLDGPFLGATYRF